MANFLDNPNTLELLQTLLRPPDAQSDSDDEHLPGTGVHKMGPGDIGRENNTTTTTQPAAAFRDDQKLRSSGVSDGATSDVNQPSSVEEWQRMQETEDRDILDQRRRPEYWVTYKQAVTTEDVYLQMSNKTPATNSCEDMILNIRMPDETVDIDAMNLSVTRNEIDLQSPVYRLKLPLMNPVDPDRGHAAWDAHRRVLSVTLRMAREYDFVNF